MTQKIDEEQHIVKRRLRETRKLRRMSAREISEKLNVRQSAICNYESHKRNNISLSMVRKLAEVLNVNPAYLAGWTDNPDPGNTDNIGNIPQETAAPTTEKLIKKLLNIPESERGDLICMLDSLTNTYLNLKKYTR